jgi:hypothetical protein
MKRSRAPRVRFAIPLGAVSVVLASAIALPSPATALATARALPKAIVFFNAFCVSCRSEASQVEAWSAREAHTYEIRGVGFMMTAKDSNAFADQLGWSFPVQGDPSGQIARRYRVQVPTIIVLVARHGNRLINYARWRTGGKLTIKRVVAADVMPTVTRFHDASHPTLTITNLARLKEAHAGATAGFQWQAKHKSGGWSPIKGAHFSTFTVPIRLEADAIRAVVTFRLGRASHALASNPSVAALAPATDSSPPTVRASQPPSPFVPTDWSGPNPGRNCAGAPDDHGGDELNTMLINADYCGATLEGLAPLTLPVNWAQLTDTQQGFVILNLERIERGELPFLGESTTLDGYAQEGAQANDDPDPPSGASWYGSNWFGDTQSADAVEGYLFDDGPGGRNLACSGANTHGCWGHRDNILENATASNLAVGLADGSNGDSTMVFGTNYVDLNFTWAAEVAAGYPQGLPSSFSVAPPQIDRITPRAGGGITVTGSNLDTVTSVWFSDIEDKSEWSCITPTSCEIDAPKSLGSNTRYVVYLENPAGLSESTTQDSYTTGL